MTTPEPTPPAPAVPAAPPTGEGFPANTPVEQMTTDQQVAYWRNYARQHEGRAKDLKTWQAENKAKVEDYDRLAAASQSEAEKAVATAKAEALAEGLRTGRAEVVPQLVTAEFLAAAAGKLTREQVVDIVAPLDKTFFLDDAGKVDAAKVSAYVAKVAPSNGGGGGKLPDGFPDLGQGARGSASTTGKEAGLAEAARRFGKPADAAKGA